MKPLGQYSDQEFIELVNEAGQLSYLEKVKLGFERFGTVQGEESRDIEGVTYQFSLAPSTKDEQLLRWEYYLESETEKLIEKLLPEYLSRFEKAYDKKKAVDEIIEELDIEYFKNEDRKRTYFFSLNIHSGVTKEETVNFYKEGRSSIETAKNLDHFFFFDKVKEPNTIDDLFNNEVFIEDLATGRALYKIQLKLKDKLKGLESMLEQFDEPKGLDLDEPVENKELNDSQKIALLYEIGILDMLLDKSKDGNISKLSTFLIALLSIKSKKESFLATLKSTINETVGKTSVNPRSIEKIKSILILSGINIPLKSEIPKNKK